MLPGSYPYRLRVVCFHREETLAGVTKKGPLRLCCRGEWDHPSSGKYQGKLRTNQPQLTPAQDDGRKRKFRVPRFVAGNQAVFSSSWTYQDLAIPQLATIGNIGPVVKGPSGEPLSTRVTFDGLPVVRANFNCTPVTRQHQACTGSLQDVGDKFSTEGTLNGTGYFGAMTSTRSVLGTDPNCPDVLVTFGHTRKLTIDEISHLVCTPYAEQVIISATFQLPSFDLDTPSSSSTPPVTIHPSPPILLPVAHRQ